MIDGASVDLFDERVVGGQYNYHHCNYLVVVVVW